MFRSFALRRLKEKRSELIYSLTKINSRRQVNRDRTNSNSERRVIDAGAQRDETNTDEGDNGTDKHEMYRKHNKGPTATTCKFYANETPEIETIEYGETNLPGQPSYPDTSSESLRRYKVIEERTLDISDHCEFRRQKPIMKGLPDIYI